VILIFGSGRSLSRQTVGYFHCPKCRARVSCEHGRIVEKLHVFFIPLFPLAEHGEVYRCMRCKTDFDAASDYSFDFSDSPEPSVWKCPQCGAENPNSSFECRGCSYRA